MIRNTLLAAALAVTGFVATSEEASAQRGRGGRGVSGSPTYGNQYFGHPFYAQPGISLGVVIPGTNFGVTYNGNYGSQYQYSYGTRGGQYYQTVPSYYYTTPGYTGVPESVVAPAVYAPTETSNIATLMVQLPTSEAQLWLNDNLTTPVGMDRQYQSPPLDSAKNYSYTVKIRWMEDGKVMEKSKDVKVEPGKTSTVSFR